MRMFRLRVDITDVGSESLLTVLHLRCVEKPSHLSRSAKLNALVLPMKLNKHIQVAHLTLALSLYLARQHVQRLEFQLGTLAKGHVKSMRW